MKTFAYKTFAIHGRGVWGGVHTSPFKCWEGGSGGIFKKNMDLSELFVSSGPFYVFRIISKKIQKTWFLTQKTCSLPGKYRVFQTLDLILVDPSATHQNFAVAHVWTWTYPSRPKSSYFLLIKIISKGSNLIVLCDFIYF